jgi:serine protease Do
LGVSECSDLAVIDLEGDGYKYLEWYEDSISTGLEVYAAGFPLGDPEFTLTRGIIAKERADGESWWASVDNVVMHDAIINPGNSGGPLVTADGQVVGVNYSVYAENQYMAIARAEALEILDKLRQGEDVTSIGVNGSAVYDGDISGIWVSSVESGSPADRAGVQEGDIILTLEGLVLSTDGTMSDYCDILRSHSATDIMDIEVLRYATSELLEGQLNGDELAVSFSFAEEIEEQLGSEFESDPGLEYGEYVEVWDDTNTLVMEVPAAWAADVAGTPLTDENGDYIASVIEASSNLDDFWGTYSTPGVAFYASELLAELYDIPGVLDELASEYDCVYDGRYDYDDGTYVGLYDLYTDCGDVGSVIVELAAMPEHQGFVTYLVIQAVSDADFDALDHILDTFFVVE